MKDCKLVFSHRLIMVIKSKSSMLSYAIVLSHKLCFLLWIAWTHVSHGYLHQFRPPQSSPSALALKGKRREESRTTNYSPGIKVGPFTVSRIPPFRLRFGNVGSGKIEKQLQCGSFEPGADVWIARFDFISILPFPFTDSPVNACCQGSAVALRHARCSAWCLGARELLYVFFKVCFC